MESKFKKLSKFSTIFSFPKIAVLGSQSSGKSSVLEQIIQKEILPRGNEIVTRCPIIINIRNTNNKEYIEIINKCINSEHQRKEQFDTKSCSSVAKHIIKLMDGNCGPSNEISSTPIEIFVYLKNAFNLTLIDLPGLTKIPLCNQPADIEEQIIDIVTPYLIDTFILAIVPANIDIATCESLKLAKKFDPENERTLGVVTKIDLMDQGTNCLNILKNISYPLKLGYVGLVCHNQKQLESKLSIASAIQIEENFFKKKKIYEDCVIGTKKLNMILEEIFLIIVKKDFKELEVEYQKKINELNSENDDLKKTKFCKNEIIYEYCKIIRELFENTEVTSEIFVFEKTAIFNYEFRNIFNLSDLDVTKFVKDEIKHLSSLILGEKLLKSAVDKKTRHLKAQAIRFITELIKKIANTILNIKIKHNKCLTDKIQSIVNNELIIQSKEFYNVFETHSKILFSFINYNHPDFSAGKAITKILETSIKRKNETWPSLFQQNEVSTIPVDFEYKLIIGLIDEYYLVIKKSFLDFCIKAIQFYFFGFIEEKLQFKLNAGIENIDEYDEDKEIKFRRIEINNEIEELEKKLNDLNEIYK